MSDADDESDSIREFIHWFFNTNDATIAFLRDVFYSLCLVAVIGAVLYIVSGVWPALVSVESGSMEPTVERGDMIVLSAKERYSPNYAYESTGVVTYRIGKQHEYTQLGGYGDVIVYVPNGNPGKQSIIHRSRFWVNKSENWYDKANLKYVRGDNCEEMPNCPAPHAGFITKGDANQYYDQVARLSRPVRPEWIHGKAMIRIPNIGYIALV